MECSIFLGGGVKEVCRMHLKAEQILPECTAERCVFFLCSNQNTSYGFSVYHIYTALTRIFLHRVLFSRLLWYDSQSKSLPPKPARDEKDGFGVK
ncbi:MAG: hypothetical protein K2H37_10805 [Lachnospiraceae bacterium]|nr:hypothetical protein [Lachnospiraceae bacterium]